MKNKIKIAHESLISSRVKSRVFQGQVGVESGVSKNAARVRLEYESLAQVPVSGSRKEKNFYSEFRPSSIFF